MLEADANERFIIYCQGDDYSSSDQLDADGNNNDNTWVAPVQLLEVDDRKVTIRAFTDENEGTEID